MLRAEVQKLAVEITSLSVVFVLGGCFLYARYWTRIYKRAKPSHDPQGAAAVPLKLQLSFARVRKLLTRPR